MLPNEDIMSEFVFSSHSILARDISRSSFLHSMIAEASNRFGKNVRHCFDCKRVVLALNEQQHNRVNKGNDRIVVDVIK